MYGAHPAPISVLSRVRGSGSGATRPRGLKTGRGTGRPSRWEPRATRVARSPRPRRSRPWSSPRRARARRSIARATSTTSGCGASGTTGRSRASWASWACTSPRSTTAIPRPSRSCATRSRPSWGVPRSPRRATPPGHYSTSSSPIRATSSSRSRWTILGNRAGDPAPAGTAARAAVRAPRPLRPVSIVPGVRAA